MQINLSNEGLRVLVHALGPYVDKCNTAIHNISRREDGQRTSLTIWVHRKETAEALLETFRNMLP